MFDRAVFLRDGRMLDVIDRPSALRSTYRQVMNRPASDVNAGVNRIDG
jgi:hypothetical protein